MISPQLDLMESEYIEPNSVMNQLFKQSDHQSIYFIGIDHKLSMDQEIQFQIENQNRINIIHFDK